MFHNINQYKIQLSFQLKIYPNNQTTKQEFQEIQTHKASMSKKNFQPENIGFLNFFMQTHEHRSPKI